MKETTDLFDYYESRAEEYDDIYLGKEPAVPDPETYKNDTKRIAEMVAKFGEGSLIDIGCGTSYWLPHYRGNVQQVTLVDKSEAMLSVAKQRVKKLRNFADRCRFLVGDFFKLTFSDNTYDCAVVGFLISHFRTEEERRFFEKLKVILKPGGELLCIDSAWTAKRLPCRIKEGMQKRTVKDKEFFIYKKYFDEVDIKNLFRHYGFDFEDLYFGEVFFAAKGRIKDA